MLLIHEIQKAENHSLTMLSVQGYIVGHKSLHRETGLWHLRLFLHVICSQILMKTKVSNHFSQLTEDGLEQKSA